MKLCTSIAVLPIFLLAIWLAGNIISIRKRLFSIAIVVLCISAAVAFNILRIQSHYTVITKLGGQISYPMEEIHFEYAILSGIIIGCIIGFFAFRTSKSKHSVDV